MCWEPLLLRALREKQPLQLLMFFITRKRGSNLKGLKKKKLSSLAFSFIVIGYLFKSHILPCFIQSQKTSRRCWGQSSPHQLSSITSSYDDRQHSHVTCSYHSKGTPYLTFCTTEYKDKKAISVFVYWFSTHQSKY